MEFSLDDVELAVVVNIATLRRTLKQLTSGVRRWWIACEPVYALDAGYITIGYGDPGCVDRLNTVYYKLPLLTLRCLVRDRTIW